MFSLIFILLIFIFSNSIFFVIIMKIKSTFISTQNIQEYQLNFNNSYFLVSLPTNDSKLYTSLPKDFKIYYDFEGFLFPVLKGIKIYYKNPLEKKFVFYAKISDLSVKNNKIITPNVLGILLFDKKYKSLIKQEICKKLRERKTSI